jgi:hypothetical protein
MINILILTSQVQHCNAFHNGKALIVEGGAKLLGLGVCNIADFFQHTSKVPKY